MKLFAIFTLSAVFALGCGCTDGTETVAGRDSSYANWEGTSIGAESDVSIDDGSTIGRDAWDRDVGNDSPADIQQNDSGLFVANEKYVNNGDGTVTEISTGLTWTRCAAGQTGYDCSEGSYSLLSWQNAIDYCERLTVPGYEDWRLPSRDELISIAVRSKEYLAFYQQAFPTSPPVLFWSSSVNVSNPEGAWSIGVEEAYVDYGFKTNRNAARCVRGEGA